MAYKGLFIKSIVKTWVILIEKRPKMSCTLDRVHRVTKNEDWIISRNNVKLLTILSQLFDELLET